MKRVFTIISVLLTIAGKAQKVDSIYFNLYTDSLKKGVYNYINVDGKLSNGTYQPMMSDEISFSSSAGRWEGNSIIIDSSFNKDSIIVTAKLKSKPAVSKTVTIYMKRNLKEERLKTEQEVLEEIRNSRKKKSLTT